MALKYGSKSGGFGLRSGNKSSLPFKQMGSSPAKGDWDELSTGRTTSLEKNPPNLTPDIYGPNESKFTVSDARKPKIANQTLEEKQGIKVDPLVGKTKAQKRKQGRLDNIQSRQDKRAYNKWLKKNKMSGDEGTRENWKKSEDYTDKKTKRETRLKKEVSMTGEDYKAYKAEKKEAGYEKARRALAGLREYSPGGSGSQTEGKMKYDAAKLNQANIEKSQESQRIRDARTEQLTEAYAANLKKEGELGTTESTATTPTGEAELGKKKFVSSSDKALQIQKDFDAKYGTFDPVTHAYTPGTNKPKTD